MSAAQFSWTPELSVGDATLDGQHERLMKQVNRLLEAITNDESPTLVSESLAFCDQYIVEHFQTEEQYMRDNGYPDIATHIALHEGFTQQFAELKQQFARNGASESLLLQLENHLAHWFLAHIGNDDKKYAVYIRQHSARPSQ